MKIQHEVIEQLYTILKREFIYDSFRHWHPRIEILYIQEGSCRVEIGKNNYLGKSGDLIVIQSGEIHDIQPNKEKCSMYICTFKPSVLYQLNRNIKQIESHITAEELNDAGIAQDIHSIFEEIHLENKKNEKLKSILIQTNIIRMYTLLLRYFENKVQFDSKNTVKFQMFQKALNYIAEHYAENITLQDIAEKLNYSATYVSIMFVTYTGVNFKTYIDSIRISKAIEMIRNTNHTIAEIATKCGYENIRTFNNTFKRITGMAPSRFKTANI